MLALPALIRAEGVLDPVVIARILNLALGITIHSMHVKAQLQLLNNEIETFVREGRNPSPEEWDTLISRSNAASERIQKAKKDEKNGS